MCNSRLSTEIIAKELLLLTSNVFIDAGLYHVDALFPEEVFYESIQYFSSEHLSVIVDRLVQDVSRNTTLKPFAEQAVECPPLMDAAVVSHSLRGGRRVVRVIRSFDGLCKFTFQVVKDRIPTTSDSGIRKILVRFERVLQELRDLVE